MAPSRRHFIATAGLGLLTGVSFHAWSQSVDTVRILVGFPAGTTPDILARKVADKLVAAGYARAVVVENRTGAGGQLAVSALKGQPADGTQLLLTPMSMLGVYPHTYKKLPYSPTADLTPVTMGARFDYGVAVGTAVPDSVKDIAGLMAWYQAHPGKRHVGSPATGSTLHFTGVMLGRAAGVELEHVGYRGSSAAVQDLLGGNLPALCAPLGTFSGHMGPGSKVRLIATSGARRSPFAPQVPTLAEQGLKDLVFEEWYGFFLPAKASPEVVARLNGALHQALKSPDVMDTLNAAAMEPAPTSPEALAAALQRDTGLWGPIVKSIGFTADN